MGFKLSELAKETNARLVGRDLLIEGVSSLARARETEISFLDSKRHLEEAKNSKAGAIIVKEEFLEELPHERSYLVVKDVRVALARIARLFWKPDYGKPGVSPFAFVEEDVELEEGVCIYPFVYIGKRAKVGRGSVIFPGVFVGEGCEVGRDVLVFPNAVLYPYTKVEDEVIIHAGAVIGADGFGYAQDFERDLPHLKIPHFGRVVLEREVEVGANSCVDRATFEETKIGAGTKIDNLVQIGHNVEVGRGSIIVAQCGLSGHVKVGNLVMMGGQVGIAPGVRVGDRARIAAQSGVVDDVEDGQEVAGSPAIPAKLWRRTVVALMRLPELVKEVRKIKQLLGGKR